jgi:hypothetical protein
MIGLLKDRSVHLKLESTGMILLRAPNLLKEMPGKLNTHKSLKNWSLPILMFLGLLLTVNTLQVLNQQLNPIWFAMSAQFTKEQRRSLLVENDSHINLLYTY